MAQRVKFFFVCALLISSAFLGLAGAQAEDKEQLRVFTSLAPVSFIVSQIGGDRVAVQTLIPPGRDPHTFSPSPRQIATLSQADIYFTVGMTFEKELMSRLTASNKDLHIVDCSIGINKHPMAHDHHQHHNTAGDPHIWLGIKPLTRLAQNITDTLSKLAPEGQQQFQENHDVFMTRLTGLEKELSHLLTPYQGRSFLVFHPSFGYFADSFGLIQEAVEIEGKSPSPRQLTAIIKEARAKEIRIIFVQPQFDKRPASRIAQAIGAELLTMDPLAANVFDNLRAMAEKIAGALGS